MLVITYDCIKELLVSSIGIRDVEVRSHFLRKGSNTTFALISVFRVEGTLDDIKLVKRGLQLVGRQVYTFYQGNRTRQVKLESCDNR